MKSERCASDPASLPGSIGLRREVKSELQLVVRDEPHGSIGLRREVKSEHCRRAPPRFLRSIGLRREVKSELPRAV